MSNFSVVIGNRACNADCPFCVSKMTEACTDNIEFNIPRFQKAMRYVAAQGVNTALITGRGEPTLYQDQLELAVDYLDKYFPCIELQTNGVLYIPHRERMSRLSQLGLNTIAFSLCSFDDTINREIMKIRNSTFSICNTVRAALEDGYTVRLSLQMLQPTLSPWDQMLNNINKAKALGVQQITFRKLGKPEVGKEDVKIREWIDLHSDPLDMATYNEWFKAAQIKKIATYHWGGLIYDVDGLSVVLADCLSENPDKFEPRSWIFDGKNLRYSWQYRGAIVF